MRVVARHKAASEFGSLLTAKARPRPRAQVRLKCGTGLQGNAALRT
jgi:hypothetical protein